MPDIIEGESQREGEPKKRPPWRPSEYKPEYCELVIECGAQGQSIAEMACACGCHYNTLQDWAERYPDFSKSFNHAKQLSLSWWEKQGRVGLYSSKESSLNAGLYKVVMSARFPQHYREQKSIEHTGPGGGPIQQETHITTRPPMSREEWIKTYVEGDGLAPPPAEDKPSGAE